MRITGSMKMAELIMMDYQLLAVVQRLNIALGFKEKSVQEVCVENGVDLNFFLQIVNSFHDKEYFPEEAFLNFPVEWLVNYLKRSHQFYIQHKIPVIEQQIEALEIESERNRKNLDLLLNFFREYIREFSSHIQLEEMSVFPYIVSLDKNLNNKDVDIEFHEHFSNYRIDKYLEEHNSIEEKLFDLKNILLKYLPPPVDSWKYNSLLLELFRLESDLQDHSFLEEKVLIPKVRIMEMEMGRLSKQRR